MKKYLNNFRFTNSEMEWQTKEFIDERFDELNDKLDQIIEKLCIKDKDEEDDYDDLDVDDKEEEDSKDFDI